MRQAARRPVWSAITLLACSLTIGATTPAASAQSSLANPPSGANNFNCKPSAAHPDPVVLVHGLGATMSENWGYISPLLAARGYCVFALTYGIDPRFPYAGGAIPIEQSAPELADFVRTVLAATKATKVDLVGHSEGTFMPQYWLKFLGGAPEVNRYVAMTPLYAGTTADGLSTLSQMGQSLGVSQAITTQFAQYCGSCPEFLAGSDMVKKLNQGGAAVPGIQYTTIPTRHDELVTPYTSGILNAPNATNMILQDVCPNDVSEHIAEAVDPVVAQIIFNALDPTHAQPISCAGLPPVAATPTYAAGGSGSSGVMGNQGARAGDRCVVPRLERMTRRRAKRALRRAHCRLGRVRKLRATRRHRPPRVARQSARATTTHPRGFRVNITLRG